ncbi:glycosyltransferase [Rhizorhabdus argentea]|uniref:glycosyltransferase n=1 Tax=Rhizorhabdus argentea TaxID=1387174 RepID=UPI0030EC5619
MIGTSARANHILIILHDFSTGGTERVAIRMAGRWAKAGRRVTILCGTHEGKVRALVDRAIHVVAVKPEIRRGLLSRWRLGSAFAPQVRTLQADLIFVPGNFHLAVASRLARLLGEGRVPMICKLSNPLQRAHRGRLRQWLFQRAARWLAAPVDGFVAMSESLHAEAKRMLEGAWIDMIAEPILDDAPVTSGIAEAEDGRPLILCIGRLVKQKNFVLAIRAFASVAPHRNARLLILGEGDQRAALQREIELSGLSNRVELAGHVTDVGPALARATMLLISSDFEGYPAVAIEALAARRPIVTTRCSPAIDEIMLHPSFGRIVDADPASMAEAITAMLDTPPPDEAALAQLLDRHRLGRASAQYLELFDRMVQGCSAGEAKGRSSAAISPAPAQ